MAIGKRYAGFFQPFLLCMVIIFGSSEVFAGLTPSSSLSLPGIARDVEIKGSVAYVSTDSGLAAVDISDPSNPLLKRFLRLPGRGNELSLRGNLAFVADGTDKAVQIVNATNPDSIHSIGFMGSKGDGYVWGIASREKAGSHGMVAVASLSGITLFDVPLCDCDSAFGRVLSRFSPYRWITLPSDSIVTVQCDSCWTQDRWIKTDDVVLDGAFAYVLYYDYTAINTQLCLKKVDIADPSNPRCIDSLELHSFGCALAVFNGYAYVVHTGIWDMLPEMEIIEVRSVPMSVKSSIRLPGPGEDVIVAGKHAYVACGKGGVIVADVSDPQLPVRVDSFSFSTLGISSAAYGIARQDSTIWVAAGDRGLLSFKTNPTSTCNRRLLSKTDGFVFRTGVNSGMPAIRLPSGFSGKASFEIFTLSGTMVVQKSLKMIRNAPSIIHYIDRTNRPLKAGMYLLRLKDEGKDIVFEQPFILQ